jgi:exopolysaccharide biosynthesis protein
MSRRVRISLVLAIVCCGCWNARVHAAETVTHPFVGVTYIVRKDSAPRPVTIHIVEIDLRAPGIRFEVTPPSGSLETIRQTTLEFLKREHAQIAINAHYFLPYPSAQPEANLIGLAASDGRVYSSFEKPAQSYALVTDAPAINIDRKSRARIVHDDRRFPDGKHVREKVMLWNAVAGSAQIVTNGTATVPAYADTAHPNALLRSGGPGNFSNAHSWYDQLRARTVIGLSHHNRVLVLFTVDGAEGSLGMTVREVADLLIHDYHVTDAINLDGGGSSTMAMENPLTHDDEIVGTSSDKPEGRSVGSNLAVFCRARSQGVQQKTVAGTPIAGKKRAGGADSH